MDRLLSYTNYKYFSSHGVNDTELIIARSQVSDIYFRMGGSAANPRNLNRVISEIKIIR